MNYTIALLIMIIGGATTGYLFGSVLFAVIIGKILKQHDVRKTGSNNPGFTNSKRVYGKKISLLILFLDIFKTVIPILIFFFIYRFALFNYLNPNITNYYNPAIFIYIPGIFSIIGHIFPIFFKFKGGKGVSSYGGLCLCLSPFIAIIGIILIVVCVLKTKKMSIGSITASLVVPFLVLIPGINYLYMMYPNIINSVHIAINNTIIYLPIFGILLLLSTLVIYRHKENIKNIINKKELTV